MNFLDAVRELERGRCKGIHQPGVNGYLTITKSIGFNYLTWEKSQPMCMFVAAYLADDWQLVDPIPQTEEVEVVRWVSLLNGDCFQEHMLPNVTDPSKLVKVTGHYNREKKRQVKRRIMIKEALVPSNINIPKHADIYAEWTEDEQ